MSCCVFHVDKLFLFLPAQHVLHFLSRTRAIFLIVVSISFSLYVM